MRKKREAEGIEWKAYYFEEYQDPESGEVYYKYIRDYWKDRKEQMWEHLQEIF